MRVLLLTRYAAKGASSRLRFMQYAPHLRAEDIHMTVSPFFDDDYLNVLYATGRRKPGAIMAAYRRRLAALQTCSQSDLLWVEKELLPWLPAWTEKRLAGRGIPWVLDYDDAVFHNYDLNAHWLVRATLGRKIDGVMRQAALVVAGNAYIAARATSARAPWVEILPTVVDLERYPPAPPRLSTPFTIGWLGSPSTARHLALIRVALAETCRGARARVVVVGSGPFKLEGVDAEIRSWNEETEATEIHSFDVGIMPLEDGPWERGKCGYKLLQYMACGLPVVASPVGVNREIVAHGVNGFLATTPAEWSACLGQLRDDPTLRQRMGRCGRDKVERLYNLKHSAPLLAGWLRAAAGQGRVGRLPAVPP